MAGGVVGDGAGLGGNASVHLPPAAPRVERGAHKRGPKTTAADEGSERGWVREQAWIGAGWVGRHRGRWLDGRLVEVPASSRH